jgi:glycosyltransferase involved in cell wall biosynthesis
VRILVLNQYFHPDRSATSQLLTELCEDLSASATVFVVTGRPSYNAVDDPHSRGIVSREWHGRVRVARVWSTTFDRSSMAGRLTNYVTYVATSLAGALSVRKPDVVVSLTDPPVIGLIGLFIARVRRRPFVLVVKDIFPDIAIKLGAIRNPVVIAVLRRIQRSLFIGADRLVSIGSDMNRRLADLGVPLGRITTIHDWADGSAIQPLNRPSAFRAKQGWGDDRFVVMHSGNVGLSQDLRSTISAAALLRDDPRFVFAIVGEGASKRALRDLVAELELTNVAFLDFQDKADLSESLGAADVHLVTLKPGLAGYIVPSKLYGILAAGKPYIAAMEPWAEPALIAEEHGCGVRVDPGDPEALAAAVKELADTGDLAGLGEAGRRAFEKSFDRPLAVDAYLRVLAHELS